MKQPTEFGIAPILMMRWDGSLRIISPKGNVEWSAGNGQTIDGQVCTSRCNQQSAYDASVAHDKMRTRLSYKQYKNYSAFLGYL